MNAIHSQSDAMRNAISRGESAIWAEGTCWDKATLENCYETHVVVMLESGQNPLDFAEWCEQEMGIQNV